MPSNLNLTNDKLATFSPSSLNEKIIRSYKSVTVHLEKTKDTRRKSIK